MELFDTHCHLTFPPLSDNLEAVLKRAENRNVTKIAVPSYDILSWSKVAKVAQEFGVYAAFGLHPWAAEDKFDLGALREILIKENAIAVGEIGLDFKTEVSKARQIELFLTQLECATALGLPVMLHVRGAFEEMTDILKNRKTRPPGVVHAFSKGPELAARFIELGYYIAFGGALTRSNAKQVKKAAQTVPIERILLETDAPCITIEGIPAIEVEPSNTADIAACLAELRGMTLEETAAITTNNAETLFNL